MLVAKRSEGEPFPMIKMMKMLPMSGEPPKIKFFSTCLSLEDDILGNPHEVALAEVDELLRKIVGSLLRKVQSILKLSKKARLLLLEHPSCLCLVDGEVAILPTNRLAHCLAVLCKRWEASICLRSLASSLLDHLAVGIDKRNPTGSGIAGLGDGSFVGGLYALAQHDVDLVNLGVQPGTLAIGQYSLELVAKNGTVLWNGTCNGDCPGRAARVVKSHEVVDNLTSARQLNVIGSSHDHNGRVRLVLVLRLVQGKAEPGILPDILLCNEKALSQEMPATQLNALHLPQLLPLSLWGARNVLC